MNKDTKSEQHTFAKVPHGIVDANLNDTLKLFLWLCFDRSPEWTYSVPEVAKTLNRTPQYIRRFVRMMIDAGAFTKAGEKKVRRQLVPIFKFHPENVPAVIESQLKARPEVDPALDGEADGETDDEYAVSHNKNNITRLSNEIEGNDIDTNEGASTGKHIERLQPKAEKDLVAKASRPSASADALQEMDEYLSTGFFTPSAVLSSTVAQGSGPSIKVSTQSLPRFQVPWGIDDKLPSTPKPKQGSRPFSVVFSDPVLRADLKKVLDESNPTEKETQGLSFHSIQRLKNKRADDAVSRFKAKHNLCE